MRIRSVVAVALAAVVVLGMAFLAYSLTSEYGATPNHGGVREVLTGLAGALPGAAVVGLLLAIGVRTRSRGRRLRAALAGALVALVAVAVGTALGQLALEARCQERGAQHSAACPGFTGPG